jgi:hypothetical protein
MEPLGKKLRLAYYDASDGPRIVFFGPLDAEVRRLQDTFRLLSRGETVVEFHNLSFVQAFGIRLMGRSCGSMFTQAQGKRQGLVRTTSTTTAIAYEWERTSEGWDYLAELIGDIVQSSSPCHQYLTAYPKEAAIIVVSKGEYGDEVLAASS